MFNKDAIVNILMIFMFSCTVFFENTEACAHPCSDDFATSNSIEASDHCGSIIQSPMSESSQNEHSDESCSVLCGHHHNYSFGVVQLINVGFELQSSYPTFFDQFKSIDRPQPQTPPPLA